MPGGWAGSDRRERLPANWPAIRRRILRRDGHQCTAVINGVRCTNQATEVDHVHAGDDHSLANLRSLCGPHHAAKSSSEGIEARWPAGRKRPTEAHPGAIGRSGR